MAILRYKPRFSMSWDGEKVSYFGSCGQKNQLVDKRNYRARLGVAALLGLFFPEDAVGCNSATS